MAGRFPSVKEGQFAAFVVTAGRSLQPEEDTWIKNAAGNVVVFFSLEALEVASEDKFNVVVLGKASVNDETLQRVFLIMKAGGCLMLQGQREESVSKLSTSLLLNGFINSQTSNGSSGVCIETQKPSYDTEAAAIPVSSAKNVWKLNANDFDDAGYELEDEDKLLDDGIDVKPKAEADFDCGPGGPGQKRRACKNCVCGLKEMLDEEEKEPNANGTVIEPNSSACGNCSKGDAFRCAGCPYLGTPSFESGSKPPIKIKEDGTKVLLEVQNEAL